MKLFLILTVSYFVAILQHWTPEGVNDNNVVSHNFKSVQDCGLYLGRLNSQEMREDTTAHVSWTAILEFHEYEIDTTGKVKNVKIFNKTEELGEFMDSPVDLYKPWKDKSSLRK